MTRVILCVFLFSTVWAQTPGQSPSLHVTKFVAPAYPWRAREARMQGETTTELQVRADGKNIRAEGNGAILGGWLRQCPLKQSQRLQRNPCPSATPATSRSYNVRGPH